MVEDQYEYDNRKIRMLISAIWYRHIGVLYRSQCCLVGCFSPLATPHPSVFFIEIDLRP